MVKNRLYENGVVIAPDCERPFFARYREEFPEQEFIVLTMEEVEELFFPSFSDEAVPFLKGKGVEEGQIEDTLAIMKRIRDKAYKSAKLASFSSYLKEMRALGIAKDKEGSGDIFKGKSIVVRLYNDGLRLAKALESLPNICVSWDLRPKENEEMPPLLRFQSAEEQSAYVRQLLKEHEGEDIVIFGSDEDFGVKALDEPFAPNLSKVIVMNADASLEYHDRSWEALLDDGERKELGLPTLEEQRKLHQKTIQTFLKQKNILAVASISG